MSADTQGRSLLVPLARVLRGVDALRNLPALYLLLLALALAGLLVSMAQSAGAQGHAGTEMIDFGAALLVLLYGASATGILLLDQARGQHPRPVGAALDAALRAMPRMIGVMAMAAGLYALLLAGIAALLWLCRLPGVGAPLFGLVLPLGVLAAGLGALLLAGLVAPLAGPAAWSGHTARASGRLIFACLRERLGVTLLTMATLHLLVAGCAALVSLVVIGGARAMAVLSVALIGIDVPVTQLLAGLFGRGLRSFDAAGVPIDPLSHAGAALIGGGVIAVLAVAIPALVYLRAACEAFLVLSEERADAAGENAAWTS